MDFTSILAIPTYTIVLAIVGVVILVIALILKKRQA
jgi:hypothetical protein